MKLSEDRAVVSDTSNSRDASRPECRDSGIPIGSKLEQA
jgi:hypothetical protein